MGKDRQTGDKPPDESTDQLRDTRRLTVREAAEEIGVSEAAVRNRITRGTLHVVRESGAVYVLLEANAGDESSVHHDEPADQSGDKPSDESRLIDVLQDQVQYLRGELEAEKEARRRADHIIAALTERIPELEAPPQSEQEAESVAGSASMGGEEVAEAFTGAESAASQESERRPGRRTPWWRRIFGG